MILLSEVTYSRCERFNIDRYTSTEVGFNRKCYYRHKYFSFTLCLFIYLPSCEQLILFERKLKKVKMSYLNSVPIGDSKVLQKPIPPRDQKYNHVQPVVDSGMTVELSEYMRRSFNQLKPKKTGELFRRAPTYLIGQFIEKRLYKPQILPDGGFARPMDEYYAGPSEEENKEDIDMLLLDCRSAEEYTACHIAGALHYPPSKIHHAIHPLLPQMYPYRNAPRKLLVMYDLEEEQVGKLATEVFMQGVDNLAVITGGLREFVQDFNHFVIGKAPVPIIPRDDRLAKRAERATQARSEARSTISHSRTIKSLSNSLAVRKSKR